MVELDLDVQEQRVLQQALENYLADLRMEIADTDSRAYRAKLKRREAVLDGVLEALRSPPRRHTGG